VVDGTLAWFDVSLRNTIHSWSTPTLTRAMQGLTQLGAPVFLAVLAVIVAMQLARAGRIRAAFILAATALGAQSFDELLKWCFHRPRPEAFFGLSPLSYSFPSGHSVASCCCYGVLAAIVSSQVSRRWQSIGIWCTASLITLAVGISRVYLGVHYPTDVLGGYAAAVFWVSLVWIAYHCWLRRSKPADA
jgi:undecaprenyl-diphosphatase